MERDRLLALEREQAKEEAKKRYQEVIFLNQIMSFSLLFRRGTGNNSGPEYVNFPKLCLEVGIKQKSNS